MKIQSLILLAFLNCLLLIPITLAAQKSANMNYIINDEKVDTSIIHQLEKKYQVTFIPGSYWYDKMTGAFGVPGGPCTGIGIAGLNIGGVLKATASGGGTQIFINGRALHPTDVAGLQKFMQPLPGRYWMDAYGNFGYEGYANILGNIYHLFKLKHADKKSSHYKSNAWSGEKTSFGSDGNFMYYSSKKADGTTYEY